MIGAYTTVAICEAVATGRYVGSHEKLSSSENNRLRNGGAYLQYRFIQFANVEFALPDFFFGMVELQTIQTNQTHDCRVKKHSLLQAGSHLRKKKEAALWGWFYTRGRKNLYHPFLEYEHS